MKTTSKFLFILIGITLSHNVNSQIKVQSNGQVGVSTNTAAITSNFQVGDITNYNMNISAIGSELRIGSYSLGMPYAFVQARDNSTRDIGFVFRTQLSGSIVNSVFILPSGYVGIKTSSPDYALDVSGIVRATSFSETSDKRLKENIKKIDNSLSTLKKLRGVTYTLKPDYKKSTSLKDSNIDSTDNSSSIDTALYNRTQIGFIAQELQQVYPNLVYEDKEGILSVNYIGLIPVIVEALKVQDSLIYAQSLKIKELKSDIASSNKSKLKSSTAINSNASETITNAFLYQNNPNPFSNSTEIQYFLPEEVQNAIIYIFNMQGELLKSNPIYNRGQGSITINASEFKPGMYIYSLIADNQEVDTKRMILTQ
jgi:hypothetical protein